MGKNLEYFLQRENNNFNLVRILCAILIIYGLLLPLFSGGGMVYQIIFNIKDISYGIYLWGFPIQQTIIHFMPNIHMLSYLILTYAVVLVFSIISFQFVEKPLNKLCKNIQNKLQTYELLRNAL